MTDTSVGETHAFSGQAYRGFGGEQTADEILSFYGDSLESDGWTSEGEPEELSWTNAGTDKVERRVNWSLTKDDLRVMILINLTPKDDTIGPIAWQIIVEPIWYPGLDSSAVSDPSADDSPDNSE